MVIKGGFKMKKAMLSQPMAGKTNEEIVATREKAINALEEKGYAMFIFPRSSTGFKLNCMLVNQVAVIDEDFRDEIKLGITNFGDKTVCLKDGQRVAQFMVVPVPRVNLIRVQDDDEFRKTDRGGGIGSTGN